MTKLGNTTVRLVKRPSLGSSSVIWDVIENFGKSDEKRLGTVAKHQRWAQNSPTKVYVYSAYDYINERDLGDSWQTKQRALEKLTESLGLVK